MLGRDEFIRDIEQDLNRAATRVDPSFAGTLANGRMQARFTVTLACENRGGEFESVVDMEKES